MPATELDVVIPTLNESAGIGRLLDDLRQQSGIRLRLIVVDGGSADDTTAWATRLADAVITAPRGRAAQMNAGVAAGSAPMLLFLHADSRLDSAQLLARALAALRRANRESERPLAGHFALRFARSSDRRAAFYRYLERKTTLNRPETWNGDQGLMISRRWFAELGGFDEGMAFLEDQILGERIRAQGRFITLPGILETSARRFEGEGEAARYFLMTLIMSARRAGLDDFFQQSRGLYREQSQTGALDLRPFVDLFEDLAGDDPRLWDALAAYGLENLWQPCLALDLALGTNLLAGHDRWLAERRPGPLVQRLGGQLLRLGVLKPLRWGLRQRHGPGAFACDRRG